MKHRARSLLTGLVASTLIAAAAEGALPVVPGASGFGMTTPAGRGGVVYRVTTLAATGTGSLSECLRATGPRVCVFEVSGVIRLSDNILISNPFLTVAGQTAPAPGIMISGGAFEVATSDVLIQHLAFRVGDYPTGVDPQFRDSLSILSGSKPLIQNVVIDHCSISWAIDENLELWDRWDNVTIRNSIISEPLHNSLVANALAFNTLIGSTTGRASFIGNLFAHGFARNPSSAATEFVMVNNIVYNSAQEATDLRNYDRASLNSIVGNVFLRGPSSFAASPAIRLYSGQVYSSSKIHLKDNSGYRPDGSSVTSADDQWGLIKNDSSVSRIDLEVSSPPTWPAGLTARSNANNAVLEYVLTKAGARPAQRNSVDARVVGEVRNRTGKLINCVGDDGSSRCAANAGGWPQLAQNSRRLSLPANPNGDDNGNGYTNLEEWLHQMAAEVEGVAAVAVPVPPIVVVD